MLHQNSQQANHQNDWHRAYGTYKTVKQTNRNYVTDRNTKLERKPDRWRDKPITRQTEGQPNRQLCFFLNIYFRTFALLLDRSQDGLALESHI